MIQVGQVLDKYELLERVGQGGMAIVYRGIDRSLKRVVAIKVLHKHLSDYQEARDRLEREAQAVAKLRHENILEIFDFAAKEGEESYIVTEFIDGQTLKQCITERPIQFPEVGAMVILQVSRALAHAHAAGILHRDVKPENIMIRSDGVVKLMDFGISHMVDLERLTVTGQLLGSPAYMAPEHVEGRPIDYRTDVFAAGIVLYQLTVGKLPFEGKNPHEVLKRIAECRFTDPRVANPRIGNRLGRIILKAMAARPDDRYPAIGEMVTALEGYLEESGIESDKIAGELARYFKAPPAYEQALKERLLDHLVRRGAKLLAEDARNQALDVFARVLTIDPNNPKVIAILDGINRKKKLRTTGLAALAIVAICGGALAIQRSSRPPEIEAPPWPRAIGSNDVSAPRQDRVMHDELPPDIDAGVVAELAIDAGRAGSAAAPIQLDAGPAVVAVRQPTAVTVWPVPRSEYRWNDEAAWLPVPASGVIAAALDANAVLHVRNTKCCQAEDRTIRLGEATVGVQLQLMPAHVTPTCALDKARVTVAINGRAGNHLGEPFTVVFGQRMEESSTVTVEFLDSPAVDPTPIKVRVEANSDVEVPCRAR